MQCICLDMVAVLPSQPNSEPFSQVKSKASSFLKEDLLLTEPKVDLILQMRLNMLKNLTRMAQITLILQITLKNSLYTFTLEKMTLSCLPTIKMKHMTSIQMLR